MELGIVRPLYSQLGRVRSADVQGTKIGIENCQFGGSLSASGNTGPYYREAEEGGSTTDQGASVHSGVERLSDQTRRSRVQLPTR